MPPQVTVLGASGFVGSAVTAALARRPVRLRLVARRPTVVPADARADVEVRTADLTSRAELDDAVAGSDAVINLVLHSSGWRGDDESATERVTVGVMGDLVEALRAGPRGGPAPVVLFAGSTSQVGRSAEMPIDGTETDRPETGYDRQKLAAERLLKAATAEGVLRGASLRLPTIFGDSPTPGAGDRGVLATMIRRALAGEPLTMWHDGTVQRDLLYVGDVAGAFLAALEHPDPLAGRHWLLGTGRGEQLGDVFRTIAELVSVHTGLPPVPVESVPPPAESSAADSQGVVVDSSAFRSVTGWCPAVSLREALTRTVATLADRPVQSAAPATSAAG